MAKNYTKDLIRKEFIKLLNRKKLHNITVTELAKACNIERKTFYYHYENLTELVKEIFDEELERVIEEFNETLSWEESFILAAKFILDNKKVVLFQTLGAEAYSDHGVSALANAGRYLSTSCKVVGTLSVRGAIDPKLVEAMMKMPEGHPHAPTEESKKRWKDASTHPDEADLEAAGEYIQKFIAFYDKFYK